MEERYNTFWPRFGAAFLDGAALAPLVWIDQILWNSSSSPILLFSWSLIYQMVTILYSVWFIYSLGQTPGKMAMGVVILDVNDRKLTLMQAILRDIVQIILVPIFLLLISSNIFSGHLENRGLGDMKFLLWFSGVMMVWAVLEFVTMLFNSKRRAIHDYIAGTVAVRQAIPERNQNYKKLRYILIGLLILSFVVPHVLPETNMKVEKPVADSTQPSDQKAAGQ